MWNDKQAKKDLKKANEFLREVAGGRITVESAFEYRDDGGIRIALPQVPAKMSLKKAANMLLAQAEAEEAMHEFTKPFDCRPMDGAVAFNKALKDVFGMTAIGKEIRSFFGGQLPELRTVKISPTEEIQVPFGLLEFPPYGAQFYLQERPDEDYGMGFQIFVAAKKKYEVEIRGLLMLVESYIQQDSIYRNKALIGVGRIVGNTYKEPEFFNPYKVDREKVVYARDVFDALTYSIWGRIQKSDLLRKVKPSLLGNKVLMHGENGTGKTLAAGVTAQYCLEHGWSFIQARYDEDLKHVMRFAELLGTPVAVVIEDIEKLLSTNPQKMDELMEQFDGMRTKGREVMLLMTSNYPEKLPPELTRAGRINRMIYVSDLDREGVEKLINVTIPAEQREDLDYERLHTAYEGFAPSWIVQALEGVEVYTLIRTGEEGQPMSTDDFVRCADELRSAWQMHTDAKARKKDEPELDAAFVRLVGKAIQQSAYVNDEGEIVVVAA